MKNIRGLLDGTLIVALITGFLTLVPFAGWAGYADYFAIPLEFLNIDFTLAARFWLGPLGLTFASVFACLGLLVGLPLCLLFGGVSSRERWYGAKTHRRAFVAIVLGGLGVFAMKYAVAVPGAIAGERLLSHSYGYAVLLALPPAVGLACYVLVVGLIEVTLESGSHRELEEHRREELRAKELASHLFFPSGWGARRIADYLGVGDFGVALVLLVAALAGAFCMGNVSAATKTHFIALKDGGDVIVALLLSRDSAVGYAVGTCDNDGRAIINDLRVVSIAGRRATHYETAEPPSLRCLGARSTNESF